jgi:hypothetical protein
VVLPSSSPVTRRSPSLHEVPQDGSPASAVLQERSDFPSPVPPLSAFARAVVPPKHLVASLPQVAECVRL